MYDYLLGRIERREAIVGVIGLGYVGLPAALSFSVKGFEVLGFDSDESKVDMLLRGQSYIRSIPSSTIKEAIDTTFTPTSVFTRLRDADAILICVPTPLTRQREPDLSFVIRSCELIAGRLRKGQLVVLESTTYPGTTAEVVAPLLAESGLRPDEEFFIAYSPEREDPHNARPVPAGIPKVVGADSDRALRLCQALYSQVVDRVVPVSGTRVAEACKILENTFRAVNIALVNELKIVFDRMGIDIWEVIDAASTKPFGFMRFEPGPGLGGHCIPVDPFYLVWKAREFDVSSRFIETAGEINRYMPMYVVGKLMEAFSDRGKGLLGARVLIVGLAYKKDVDDARESPAFKIMELLEGRGARVDYHDPYLPVVPKTRDHAPYAGRHSVSLERARDYDAVVIVTNHDCIDYDRLLEEARLIVDTRGVYRGRHAKVVKA